MLRSSDVLTSIVKYDKVSHFIKRHKILFYNLKLLNMIYSNRGSQEWLLY